MPKIELKVGQVVYEAFEIQAEFLMLYPLEVVDLDDLYAHAHWGDERHPVQKLSRVSLEYTGRLEEGRALYNLDWKELLEEYFERLKAQGRGRSIEEVSVAEPLDDSEVQAYVQSLGIRIRNPV